MKLSLEFSEKKQELQPALQLVCKAIDGNILIYHLDCDFI